MRSRAVGQNSYRQRKVKVNELSQYRYLQKKIAVLSFCTPKLVKKYKDKHILFSRKLLLKVQKYVV